MAVKAFGVITLVQVSDGEDGATTWSTTTAPTTPNYTFTIVSLTGRAGATPKVGDIIFYSYYRYTITSVSSLTVLAPTRVSIRGATGAAGATGVSVTSIIIQYALHTSRMVAPATGWDDPPAPEWEQGSYIWQRTKVTYSDGVIVYVGIQCIESQIGDTVVDLSNWLGTVDAKYDAAIEELVNDDALTVLDRSSLDRLVEDIATDTTIMVAQLGNNTAIISSLQAASTAVQSFLITAAQASNRSDISTTQLKTLYAAYKTQMATAQAAIVAAQTQRWTELQSGQVELGERIGNYENRLRLESDLIAMYINRGHGLEKAMELAQEELAFYVANQKRAWIGLNGLNAEQAAITESLTVGNHKMTKLGTDYTIIGWTGE